MLNPCDADYLGGVYALAAKPGPAQNMRGKFAVGVKPHFARTKLQTGLTDIMHRLHLLGGDFALQPDEFSG